MYTPVEFLKMTNYPRVFCTSPHGWSRLGGRRTESAVYYSGSRVRFPHEPVTVLGMLLFIGPLAAGAGKAKRRTLSQETLVHLPMQSNFGV